MIVIRASPACRPRDFSMCQPSAPFSKPLFSPACARRGCRKNANAPWALSLQQDDRAVTDPRHRDATREGDRLDHRLGCGEGHGLTVSASVSLKHVLVDDQRLTSERAGKILPVYIRRNDGHLVLAAHGIFAGAPGRGAAGTRCVRVAWRGGHTGGADAGGG